MLMVINDIIKHLTKQKKLQIAYIKINTATRKS